MTARRVFDLPTQVHDFGERRVAVVAPHMDDEVIGCGGTIVRHIEAGAQLTTIFLTDGSVGRPRDAAVDVRHNEARQVAARLKTEQPRFLDAPDTQLARTDLLARRLAEQLNDLEPELVYAPWVGDAHRDHEVANDVLAASAAYLTFSTRTLRVRSYEVWSPLRANISVDISEQMNRKLLTLQLYQSQFVAHDPAPLLGLNRYRSMSVPDPAVTYAECFDETSWQAYVSAIEAVR